MDYERERYIPELAYFDVRTASEYGIVAAIILEKIYDAVNDEIPFREKYQEGKYWITKSLFQYSVENPYLSDTSIKRAFRRLISDGLVIKKRFKPNGANSYTYTEKARKILEGEVVKGQ